MSTPRQSISFPDVAIIHKGTPKQKLEKDGRTVEIQGKDLNNKFRIHFLPGTDDVRRHWHAKHAAEYKKYGDKFTIPDGYEVESFRVVIPAQSVWDAWDYGNEVYNAGRRIALANDEQYITLRDPLTGEFIVKDGKPFKKFTPGDTITYKKGDKDITLTMKTHGRLRLVFEDLVNAGQLVQAILKTTSFYDCQNIQRQLAGIQALADSVNNGNAGGIPLVIYRAEQEVVWNKKDGGAARVKKWFINIKADPNWVKNAFARLNKNALTGAGINTLMLPGSTMTGEINPDSESFESGDEEPSSGFIESTARDVPPDDPAPAPAQAPAPETSGAPDETKHAHLSAIIVDRVAKRAGVQQSDAAKYLASAEKDGRIGKELTLAEAEEFCAHLNV